MDSIQNGSWFDLFSLSLVDIVRLFRFFFFIHSLPWFIWIFSFLVHALTLIHNVFRCCCQSFWLLTGSFSPMLFDAYSSLQLVSILCLLQSQRTKWNKFVAGLQCRHDNGDHTSNRTKRNSQIKNSAYNSPFFHSEIGACAVAIVQPPLMWFFSFVYLFFLFFLSKFLSFFYHLFSFLLLSREMHTSSDIVCVVTHKINIYTKFNVIMPKHLVRIEMMYDTNVAT